MGKYLLQELVMSGYDVKDVWESVQNIRKVSPVVHNITNYVVMNSTANALLAIGASPVMAHAMEEMDEMVNIASALVINIGTLSREWIKAMFKAAEKANVRGIPIILDPVGAGATSFRTETAREFIKTFRPSLIRGNASEIMSVFENTGKTKGVDSTETSHDAVSAGKGINEAYGSAVCISGETDYIIGAERLIEVRNGHPMMTKVTGMGCAATALCGAFSAVNKNYALAAAQAMAVMGVAGEIAADGSSGPGTLQVRFLDALYNLSIEDIGQRLKVEC
jgi:hydroxyethylthiazole kinase